MYRGSRLTARLHCLTHGVFAPYAVTLRLLGKDLLDAGPRTRDSYWVRREPQRAPKRYRRQY